MPRPNAHRISYAVAGTAAVAVLTGCSAGLKNPDASSVSTASRSPTTAAASTTPSEPPNSAQISVGLPSISGLPSGITIGTDGATVSVGGSTTIGLPNFPLPPGATVTAHVNDGKEIAATISVGDARAAYTFWKTALPKAGYPVSEATFAAGAGELRFTGHGCGGDSQIALTPIGAAVQCDQD